MDEQPVDVAIIGAGFSGIIAGLTLRDKVKRLAIFDRGSRIGGVWRDTLYPGAACDVPSNLYSIASHPNPDWSHNYASREEIHAYLERLADSHLNDVLQLGIKVNRLRFLKEALVWEVEHSKGVTRARAVIIATGPHSRPREPNFPGLENFRGSWCHSAAWNNDITLSRRNVVVIGAGASAVQIIPAIAPLVGRLTAIQRTTAWVLPRWQRTRPWLLRELYRRVPALQSLDRARVYWLMELAGLGNLGNHPIAALFRFIALAKLRNEVRDHETRRKLTPDYAIGCKRVMVSDDYWPTFNQPHVHLERQSLVSFSSEGPVLADGRVIPADHVIFATGYVVADADGFLPIEGLPGHSIPEDWAKESARAYLGTVIAGYPNLAFLLGPNSGLSHSSVLQTVESQMTYITQWLEALRGCGALNLRADVEQTYNSWLKARFGGTVWAAGCKSWYLDKRGQNTVIYPGLTAEFSRRLAQFDLNDFDIVSARETPVEP